MTDLATELAALAEKATPQLLHVLPVTLERYFRLGAEHERPRADNWNAAHFADDAELVSALLRNLPTILKWKADLDAAKARIAKLEEALRKIAPIRVENGPDYAEVFFSDGVTHSTRAMTMNPQDWIDLSTIIGGESDDPA